MLTFSLKTESSACCGRRLAKAAVSILSDCLQDDNLLYDLDLVLTEACANVIKHAYPNGSGPLFIELRIEQGEHVEFEVIDQGVGFEDGQRDFSRPADPAAVSGRGLYIISKLVDAMEIRKRGSENVVFFSKTIGKQAWKTCA